MGLMQTAAEIWRKYAIAGVPASGENRPDKTAISAWGTFLETMIGAGAPGLAYATLSALAGDLAHGASATAVVYNDATAANNGWYVKAGASGSGSWSRIGDLPNAIVPVTVTGGTANAIVASGPETPQQPGRKLFLLTPTANNAGATTLNYNGQGALPVLSAFGIALVGGELLNNSPVLLLGAADRFTLLLSTNVDASGILAAAQAAQTAAAASAAAAASSAAAFNLSVPLGFGVVGNGTADDRAAIQATIDSVAAAGGGYVHLAPGKTYRVIINSGVTDRGLIIKSGVTLLMNGGKFNLECTGSVYGVRLQSNSHIINGTVAVTVSSSPGAQVIWHAPISVGAAYGDVTSVGALGNYINAERWSIRNMKIQSVRSGGGKIVGMGGVCFGVIEDIEFPSDATSVGCINFDWGTVGSINSADVPASRTAFNAGTAYTVHPNNIDIRRLKVGAMTFATSNPIRLSGVHSIRISDFEIAQSNGYGVFHTAGDLGYEFAPSDVKRQRHRGIVIRNGSILAANTGVGVYCDAHADNVALAIASGYSALLDATQTSDILFENIRSIGNIGSTAGTGVHIRYIDGGTIRNCFALGHQRGVLVAEAAKRVRIEGGEYTTNYREGILIGAGTAPEEITVDGAWCYSNGTGGTYGGIYVQTGIKHTITRCRVGGVSESFQEYGIVVDAACGDVEVSFNHCQGHAAGGAAYLMGSATSYGCLRLFTGNTVNTLYVTTVFSGLTIVPIEFTYTINGRMRRHLAQRVSLSSGITPTAGTWAVGDVIDYSDPLATGYRGVICTVAGSPGTWNRYGVSV